MNFKNMGDAPTYSTGGSGGRPSAGNNFSLTRQPSIYSLTFEEFQNSVGGLRKDFGSMNMDEFLRNIWTAEESQALASSSSSFAAAPVPEDGGLAAKNLQRQGSLTLPRTLSQKTVDEVWKEIFKENCGGKDANGSNLQQRQQTLGEITLEEFLVRAGVVREDAQLLTAPKSDNNNNNTNSTTATTNNNNNSNTRNNGFYGELLRSNDTTGLALGFGQQGGTNGVLAANQVMEISNNPSVSNQSPNTVINMNGDRANHQQQQLFPKQSTVAYASPIHLASKGFVQGGRLGDGGIGIVGARPGSVTVAAVATTLNQLSSDGAGKSTVDTASLSPVSYMFNGGLSRKRGIGAVEKVVERRQRRMIKNRESAARSRARKQAYTMELEAEVTKLKEENQELRKKQAEIMAKQKNQILETMIKEKEAKKRGLRRTQTGPW